MNANKLHHISRLAFTIVRKSEGTISRNNAACGADWQRALCRAVLACSAAAAVFAATAASLNDTGQTQCYNATHQAVACGAAVGGDVGILPRQDARYGRDAQAAPGATPQLSKTGAGAAGLDYTKISNSGTALAATANLGSAPTDWACTKDNVTGLTWEVKTLSGPRTATHTYTWYSTSGTTNGGSPGSPGTAATCSSTLAQCNAQAFLAAANTSPGLCGATNWRIPTRKELLSIDHAGAAAPPMVDGNYFPNTSPIVTWIWTASTHAGIITDAWYVDFSDGNSYASPKSTDGYGIRLVSGPQQ